MLCKINISFLVVAECVKTVLITSFWRVHAVSVEACVKYSMCAKTRIKCPQLAPEHRKKKNRPYLC